MVTRSQPSEPRPKRASSDVVRDGVKALRVRHLAAVPLAAVTFTGRFSSSALARLKEMIFMGPAHAQTGKGLLLLVLVACIAMAAQSPNVPRSPVAFVDAKVVPMDSDRILPHITVVTDGGRIVAVGPARGARIPRIAQRIDGKGRFLMPGLAICTCTLAVGDRRGC